MHETFCSAIFLLVKKDRTARELATLMQSNPDTIGKYLHLMEAEGLVQRMGRIRKLNANGRPCVGSEVWHWTGGVTCESNSEQ